MRQKWLELYAETGSVTKTALLCGIARSTLYRWINRGKEEGKSELSDKSKRPFIFFPNYQKITLIKTDDEKEFSISLNGVFNAEFCSL